MSSNIHPDLYFARTLVYDLCHFHYTDPILEHESQEYGAAAFQINNYHALFRTSKITPTKTGQFVTIWKRNNKGPIEPFHISDDIDLIIISSRKDDHMGQFIFPKDVLYIKGIISDNIKEGKRGIRVYPPWDDPVNSQGSKTQKWQLEYFLDLSADIPVDLENAKKLFNPIKRQ